MATTITLKTNPPITVSFDPAHVIDEKDLRLAFGLDPQAPFLICDANNHVVNWRKPLGYQTYTLICEQPAAVLLPHTCQIVHTRIAELFADTRASIIYVDHAPMLQVNIVLTSSIVNSLFFQRSVTIRASVDNHPGVKGIASWDPLPEAKTMTATNTSGYSVGLSANLGLNPTGGFNFAHTDTTQLQEARNYWETRVRQDTNWVRWTLQHNHHAYHQDMNQLYHTTHDCFDPLSEGSITKQFSVTFRLDLAEFPLGQKNKLVLKLKVDVYAVTKEKDFTRHYEEPLMMATPLSANLFVTRVQANNWWIEPTVDDPKSAILLKNGQSTTLY